MDESDIFPTTKKLLSNLGSGSQWPVFKVRALSLTLTALAASHTRDSCLVTQQTRLSSSLMSADTRECDDAPGPMSLDERIKMKQTTTICALKQEAKKPRSRLIYFLRGSSLIIFCCLLREVGPGSRLFIMRNVIIVIFWGFSSLTMTPDILHVSGKKVSWLTWGDDKPRDTSRS